MKEQQLASLTTARNVCDANWLNKGCVRLRNALKCIEYDVYIAESGC